jgi:hypothetical protein
MTMPTNGLSEGLPCGDTFCRPEFEDLTALFCPYRNFGCKKMSKSEGFPFHGDELSKHKVDAMSVVSNPCLRSWYGGDQQPPIIKTN